MLVLDEINEILEKSAPHNFNPSEFLLLCMKKLDNACSLGGELDPREIEKAESACNSYGTIAFRFLENEFSFAAESLLVDAWNKFGLIQLNERKRIYRAGLAAYLSKMYLKLKDKGAALRWALHTQADDILGEHSEEGGAGKHTLLTILRMSNEALTEFNAVSAKNRDLIKNEYGNDWSIPLGFAEDAVRKFALEKRSFAHLLAAETSINEYPLSSAYFSALLKKIDTVSENTTSQGDTLEDLASYLFLLIPGWVPRRNLIDERWAYETDLVVRNLNVSGNLTAELLGRHFIVECKNMSTSMGVRDVGYFLYRMKLTHAKFGVIFAKNDISGAMKNSDEWYAYQLVRKSFHEDGNICIVLNKDDLEALRDGKTTVWPMLLDKIETIRFGKEKT